MKTTLFLLAILLLLASCGRGVEPPQANQGEFRAYAEAFEETARAHGKDLKGASFSVEIKFGTPREDGKVGYCERSFFTAPEITILKEWWEKLPNSGRKVLLFHELGHCVLHRDHTTNRSIMIQRGIGADEFERHEGFYEAELFGEE